jgi:NACHT domain
VGEDIKMGVESLKSDSHLNKVKKWLSPPDTSTNYNEAKKARHPGTGTWFLASQPFVEWKSGSRRHLWLRGLAGCGKTVLTSAIIDDLNSAQADSCVILDFFFTFSDKEKQQLDNLLRSLAFQLYAQCTDCHKVLDSLFASHEDGRKQPTTDSLSTCVHTMMRLPKKAQIVLDALDECDTRNELLEWLETLSHCEPTNVQLIATSRQEEELESALSKWIHDRDRIAIDRDAVNGDIQSYIHARLEASGEYQRRWAAIPSVLEEIKSGVGGKADGM